MRLALLSVLLFTTVQGSFEDREGTLWVLTAQGIDAFRELRVSSVTSREGLSADLANAVLATRDGAVWINTWHSSIVPDIHEGVWNESGASLDFSIAPAFYQTRWFDALCITAGVGVLWLLYLIRVRQIEMRIRRRLEERVIERERIARDLHDTLLQSVQGLILRFQAVLARIPEGGERPMQMMEQALERADQVLAEGRDRVYDLRKSTHASNDLPQALQAFAEELAQSADITQFRVTVEGTPRTLHPVVREETYRVGAEALTNAVRHAVATHVDTEISYSRKGLTLRVVDDGRGFDAAMLHEGAPRGHFGLTGMRERARRIHARFEVSTRPGSGSAVEVRVPASIAYRVARRLEATAASP